MTEPSLRGSLASFRLPDVLTFVSSAKKSGTLTLTSGSSEAIVYFEDGAVIFAGSNQETLRLSAVLLRKKHISTEQRDAIDALMKAEGGRFGQLAVQQGLLTEEQLRDFLKVQVSEIIYDCFVWPDGNFAFLDGATVPPYAVTIAVDLSNLIMEGARRIAEWEECERLLPDAGVVFRVVSNPDAEKITLTLERMADPFPHQRPPFARRSRRRFDGRSAPGLSRRLRPPRQQVDRGREPENVARRHRHRQPFTGTGTRRHDAPEAGHVQRRLHRA